jgi:hypothetical protein
MVNERINGLQDYFQKQTGCTGGELLKSGVCLAKTQERF